MAIQLVPFHTHAPSLETGIPLAISAAAVSLAVGAALAATTSVTGCQAEPSHTHLPSGES